MRERARSRWRRRMIKEEDKEKWRVENKRGKDGEGRDKSLQQTSSSFTLALAHIHQLSALI